MYLIFYYSVVFWRNKNMPGTLRQPFQAKAKPAIARPPVLII